MAFFAPIVIFFQFFLQTGNSLIIFAADFKDWHLQTLMRMLRT